MNLTKKQAYGGVRERKGSGVFADRGGLRNCEDWSADVGDRRSGVKHQLPSATVRRDEAGQAIH